MVATSDAMARFGSVGLLTTAAMVTSSECFREADRVVRCLTNENAAWQGRFHYGFLGA